MNTRHKYFRNQRYKQKLERLYTQKASSGSFSVTFITEGPDPKEVAVSEILDQSRYWGRARPSWE